MTQTDVGQTTQQQAAAVGQSAKREGAAVMDSAKEQGSRLVSETRRELRDHGDQQAHRIASSVRDASQQLHAMASGQGGTEGAVADAARQLAQKGQALAQRLDEDGVDGLADDLKQFARRRPGLYLAGAFALGVVGGRIARNADTRALKDAAKPSSGGQSGMATGQAGAPAGQQPTGRQPMAGEATLGTTAYPATGSPTGAPGTGAAIGSSTAVGTEPAQPTRPDLPLPATSTDVPPSPMETP